MPHRRALVLLPRASAPIDRATESETSSGRSPATTPSSRCGREVLGDLTTPVAAFLRVVGDGPGFLLESVEHERWSRWSFVGRDPLATIVARGRELAVDRARCRRRPDRPGRARRRRVRCSPRTARRACPSCRRCTAASSATSATTSCARSSACPTSRPTTSATPTPCSRSSATSPPTTTGASGSRSSPTRSSRRAPTRPPSTPPTTTPAAASSASAAGRRPVARRAARRPAGSRRPAARGHLVDGQRRLPRGHRGGSRAHPRRRHLPGRAGPAVRVRPRRRAVRRLPGAAPGQPEPVHVLRAHARR